MAIQHVFCFLLAAISIINGCDENTNVTCLADLVAQKLRSPRVAFSAVSTKNQALDDNTNVRYDKVYINEGNGFDDSSSVFIAPVSGVYSFHFATLSQEASPVWIKMYKNSEYIISIYSRDDKQYDGTGNSVILRLRQSDKIELRSAGSSLLYGKPEDIYNTFSGFLLFADE